MSALNPNARTFSFNPAASNFAPSFTPPQPPPEPSKEATPNPIVPPPPAVEVVEVETTIINEPIDEVCEDEIDETDPLWLATLKITNGDRKEAVRLLEDPDSLMKYPEIRAIMEKSSDEDDWEKVESEPIAEVIPEPDITAPLKTPTNESTSTDKVVTKSASSKATTPSTPAVDGDDGAEDEIQLQDDDPRQHLNLVFIGHVDAGKSTLSGSILYIMGKVDARTIERYEREAKQRNRESWFLAFIMDTSEEERAKGKTVEVGRAHFETDINRYTILDAPGHKNYVPNMITGASQADVGILVISARKGEFETGFEKGGQTREHALLAKTLGVQYLVVVINKMDDPTVMWDVKRYDECVSKLKPYLKQCGYVIKRDVKFIPLSGLSGDNVLNEVKAEKCPWWGPMWKSGGHNTTTPTLLSTLDALAISGRNPDAPLRVPCLDRYFERGCVVLGKIESGTLRMDDEIVIAPTKKRAKVDGIYIGETKVRSAKPGENVLIKFSAINVEDIQKGFVLCYPSNVCPAVTEVVVHLALVDMLDHRPIFSPGYEAVLHMHTVEIEVTVLQLLYIIDAKGQKLRRPFARQGQQCMVRLGFRLSTCAETFTNMPSMGRFTLRDEGTTIGIGKVVEALEK